MTPKEMIQNYAAVRARLMGRPERAPAAPKATVLQITSGLTQRTLPVIKIHKPRKRRDFIFIPNSDERESRVKWKSAQHEHILADIMEQFDISRAELTGLGQTKKSAEARDEASARLREELGYSLPMIGKVLNRHHTSILMGLKRRLRKEGKLLPVQERC